ncbi:uncharacterized protein LOC110463260 isoform X3 [Mizuhopecten yessoensis]|uniref:uncharacterized protein LOC110463260 isoform X3 n=1 Tax=Mizuhopecten yessoensis TaxID=6573 RepID=UPI000B45D83C|nr:uncharacterized protein LOC110463260 isoform X3 [Mizuhopecten yessoensis]
MRVLLYVKMKGKWWMIKKIKLFKNYLQAKSSADIVQLYPALGYYVLLCMLFFQLQWYTQDSWEASNMYVPPSPVPREHIDNMAQLEDGITFVTAYFDLGTFKKGSIAFKYFGKQNYKNWMTAFSKLNNSVILFTDSLEIEILFRNLRKQFPSHMTRIINIQQDSLWSFKLAPQIKQIYAQPGYPHYPPNTVNEKYSCAMHVKYEALEMVIRQKQYKTKQLAWIDIGYFRDKETKPFTLEIPPDLKKDHIAFMQIDKFEEGLLPLDIIGDNMVWIAGGMFLGQPDYLLTFIADYRRTVESLIVDKMMSTDQQVLYIMYSKNTKVRARVPIQVYYHICRCDWFFLGSICRYTWEKKHWHRPPVGYFGALAL